MTIYGNNDASMLIQATSPDRIKVFKICHDKEAVANLQRIFCGGYDKPIVCSSISLELTKDILKENALQKKILSSLGVYLTPLLPALNIYDCNWKRLEDAFHVMRQYGKRINVGKAIEMANDLAENVGISTDNTLRYHIPTDLFNYLRRMSKRKKVRARYTYNRRRAYQSLEQKQLRKYLRGS